MLSGCANARCGRPLHYLREGKVFVFEVARKQTETGGRSSHLEHYWLCGECSRTSTLTMDATGAIAMASKPAETPVRDDVDSPMAGLSF